MADEIQINMEDLSIDEMELIEDTAGASFDDIMEGKSNVRSTRVLRAFALMALRRLNPNATLAEAGKVKIVQLNAMLGIGEGAVPFEKPADEQPASNGSGASRKARGSRSKT